MTNKDFAFLTPKGKSFNRYDVFTIISDGRFIYVNDKKFEKPAPVFALEAYSGFFKSLSKLPKFELDFTLTESGNLLITSQDKQGVEFECNVTAVESKPIEQTPIDPKASLHLTKLECACLETVRYKKKDKDGFSGVGFDKEHGAIFTTNGVSLCLVNKDININTETLDYYGHEFNVSKVYSPDFLKTKSDVTLIETPDGIFSDGKKVKCNDIKTINYTRILPTTKNESIKIDLKSFLQEIKRATDYTDDKYSKILISFRQNTIHIESVHSFLGRFKADIWTNEILPIKDFALDGKELTAFLKNLKGDIEFELYDKLCIITCGNITFIEALKKYEANDYSLPDDYKMNKQKDLKPAKSEKKTDVKPMKIEDKVSIIPVGFETPIDPKAINAKAKLPSRGFPPAVKEYLESKKTTVISPNGHIEKPAESKPITVISAKDGRAYTGRVATKLIEHMTNKGYSDNTFGTYPQWIKQGRIVMKGQKGLRIETESYSFTVFNKEQTMEVSK
jgi:hypothetical protein